MRKRFHENRAVRMSVKQKGSKAERELLHMFWAKNFATIRSAGSGSMKYPGPDLLVGKKDWRFLSLEDLKKTKSGYVIDSKVVDMYGISFEELISYKIKP